MTEALVVVKALPVESLVAETALASRRWTMFLPLVVNEAGMAQCTEAATLFGTE